MQGFGERQRTKPIISDVFTGDVFTGDTLNYTEIEIQGDRSPGPYSSAARRCRYDLAHCAIFEGV